MREFIRPVNTSGRNPNFGISRKEFQPPLKNRFSNDRPSLPKRIVAFVPRLFSSKKKLILWAILIAVVMIVYFIWGRKESQEAQVYEALVNVVDQKASDPVEDARSSLKKGDVIAVFPEGHSWSDTEKYSYLIVKIKMTPDDAAKLTQAKTKEVKREKEKGPDGKEIDMGPEVETVLARQYTLDLPGFDTQKFWSEQKQPFADKVFDSGIIDKK